MNFTPAFINTKEKLGDPVQDVRYLPISNIMVRKVITFSRNTPINEAISVMLQHKISGAPVVNSRGKVEGMLSEKDCLQVLLDDGYYNCPQCDHTVADYMTQEVYSLHPNTDLLTAARAFIDSSFRRFPVVDHNGLLVGQISRIDVLKAAHRLHTTTWK
jgi:CBS domain-containing protein